MKKDVQTPVLGRCAASGGFFQDKKASENIIMRIYENIVKFICFSKKTAVLGRCAASGVLFSGKKGSNK